MSTMRWIVAACGVVLIALACAKTAGPGPYALDGSYYYQIARNLAEGEGFVTTVSLYHHGLVLPQPATTVVPVWTALLGLAGRVVGIQTAVQFLPRVFYVASIALLFLLARAISRSSAIALTVAALFALNPTFYAVTTHPYREGAAFAFAFAALWLFDRFARTESIGALIAAGVVSGIATLTRMPMIAVPAGIAAVLAVDAVKSRRARPLSAFVMSAATAIAPWLIYVRTHPLERVPIGSTPEGGRPMTLSTALEGLLVAFDPRSPHSFVHIFSMVALLVPIAAGVALWSMRKGVEVRRESMTAWATGAAGAIAVAMLLPLAGGYRPWYFGWRHGLMLIFALTVSVPFLFRHAVPVVRGLAMAAAGISLLFGAWHVGRFIRLELPGFSPGEKELVAWVNASPKRPMILTANGQWMGMATKALVHDTDCRARPDITRKFLSSLPIDYVIVRENERPCPFVRGLGRQLTVARTFGPAGQRIYVLERKR